jgi:hypothetical protein
MNDMTAIQNEEKLTGIFGQWPSFHDAEIISIYLDRGDQNGPFLEMKIHVFEMTNQIDAKGFYILKNHTLATIRFTHIGMGEIKWFNQQNVIAELTLEEVDPKENDGCHFNVLIESSYGCDAAFGCREIVIAEVEPYEAAA